MGSGCRTVGRMVASYIKQPEFKIQPTAIKKMICLLITVEKTKINKKRPRMTHLKTTRTEIIFNSGNCHRHCF